MERGRVVSVCHGGYIVVYPGWVRLVMNGGRSRWIPSSRVAYIDDEDGVVYIDGSREKLPCGTGRESPLVEVDTA